MNDQTPFSSLELSKARLLNVPGGSWGNFLRNHRWFMLFVVLPTALAILYYGLIASDQYISQSRFVVKAPGQKSSQISSLASLIQTTGLSAGQEQTNEVMDYIRSRNALSDLQERSEVKTMFATPAADWLARYPSILHEDKFENLYKYYTGKVETHLDHETGLAVLETKAFRPQDAHALNAELLDLSEELVNRLNERSRSKAIAEAERRVQEAQARIRSARIALTRFRNSEDLIDPAKQATGIFEVIVKLTGEKAAMQSQLDVMQQATPGNPAIASLRGRIAAVQQQIDAQTGRVVGRDNAISSKLGSYENLMLEQEFAAQMLTMANASLEQARTEAEKQQFYLERAVEPNTPDLGLYPQRLRSILVIFGAAICLYFIGWMLIVGILEHSPED
ncbi:MAG TPA: hypothetical protein VJ734_09665 [Nitrosospira sp.]|nr:hypothetical protein [Nitrosospira sp.]